MGAQKQILQIDKDFRKVESLGGSVTSVNSCSAEVATRRRRSCKISRKRKRFADLTMTEEQLSRW